MKLIKHSVVLLVSGVLTIPVFAADFDGSKFLICATVEARDCVPDKECFGGSPGLVGAPAFMRIDFENKLVIGTERSSPIASMEKNEVQLLLQGSELDYGWSLALDQMTGQFSASLTNSNGTFLLFGSCTPL